MMFYVPYKLRKIKERITPRGPDFAKAEPVSLDLGGNIVRLDLNQHNPLYGDVDPEHVQGKINIYDPQNYESGYAIGAWQKHNVLVREWRFNGPMFTGGVAEVHFVASVLRRPFTQNETMFSARQFEQEVLYLLTEQYSKEKEDGYALWQAPVNWQTHNTLPVCALSYDTLPIYEEEPAKRFTFPISEDCLFSLYFSQYQEGGGDLGEKAATIDRSTMEKLCYDIISSVRLELSPASQTQLKQAQQNFPNEKISTTMTLLNWTNAEEEKQLAEDLAHDERLRTPGAAQKS